VGNEDVGVLVARAAVPTVLQVLKVNPARQLYERLGFRRVGETATHFKMQADRAGA
jgi:hypothetical protein